MTVFVRKTHILIFRLILGFTLLFSSLAKVWSIKSFDYIIEQYLLYWHIPYHDSLPLICAYFIIFLEFIIGFSLLINKIWSHICGYIVIMFAFFTIITIVNLTDQYANIQSCGCFGELIHISPTVSLIKNVILTFCSIVLFYQILREKGTAFCFCIPSD